MVTRVLIALAATTLAIGCEKRSTKYCGLHENDLANCEQTDAPLPEPVACTMNSDCTDAYCELGANICVECLDNSHCDASERCDTGGSYTCRGCISDTDCPGGSCLPGGSCGDDATVIYVEGGGTDDGECGNAAPCATIIHAVSLLTPARTYIHVAGELTESPAVKGTSFDVIAAPGAKLNGVNGTDWVFKVEGSVVSVSGLEVFCTGGTDQNGFLSIGNSTLSLDGVELSGCGRDAAIDIHGGFTVIDHANIHDNAAGGIKTDAGAKFAITNSWIHHNGALGFGGITTDADMLEDVRIELNTIVDNSNTGIDCKNSFALPNNIIGGNYTGIAPLGAFTNVTGCDAAGSLVTDNLDPLVFTNRTAAPYDYHIGATSTAKDNTTVPSAVLDDIDGDLRPQDAAKDFGADEYKAP